MRAASLAQTDLKGFILRSALEAADAVIGKAETLALSERDTRLWLDLLDHPPRPNERTAGRSMTLPAWREVAIEKTHNRRAFDCGQAELNAFLAQHARKAHERSISKTYVAIDETDRVTVHGFYTVSPAQVAFSRVPLTARPSGGRSEAHVRMPP
eukprot:gene53700-73433_t